MKDATSITFGDSLRYFFCSLLILCQPVNPLQFWNDWKNELCRDKMLRVGLIEPNALMIAEVLMYIKRRLQREELTMGQFNLTHPDIDNSASDLKQHVTYFLTSNVEMERREIDLNMKHMT